MNWENACTFQNLLMPSQKYFFGMEISILLCAHLFFPQTPAYLKKPDTQQYKLQLELYPFLYDTIYVLYMFFWGLNLKKFLPLISRASLNWTI